MQAAAQSGLATSQAGAMVLGNAPRRASAEASTRERIDRLIAAIDREMTAQVNVILHHPGFQRLEASWRGLAYLTRATAEVQNLKLKLLPVSWRELCRDLDRAGEFDQSRLFELVYSQEFGTPGGEPFGLLLGDYAVGHKLDPVAHTDDVAALKAIAGIGAAAFVPFVTGARPDLLGLDHFTGLDFQPSLATGFASVEFIRWESLRDLEDARFLGLVAPRILMRLPYPHYSRSRVDGFLFEEHVQASGEGLLWGNGVWAFGRIVMRAFARAGWFADLRGAPQDQEAGGIVTDLPTLSFATDRPKLTAQPPVEIRLTSSQERELADFGLIPVGCVPFTPYLVFNTNPSLHRPARSRSLVAEENARLAAMLQYVLCASRFAHHLKVMIRDQIGRLAKPAAIETMIATWLARHCLGNDDAPDELKATFPLRDAAVEVRELPGRPGMLGCMLRLQPHYQLDDVAASFQLFAEVTAAWPRA